MSVAWCVAATIAAQIAIAGIPVAVAMGTDEVLRAKRLYRAGRIDGYVLIADEGTIAIKRMARDCSIATAIDTAIRRARGAV